MKTAHVIDLLQGELRIQAAAVQLPAARARHTFADGGTVFAGFSSKLAPVHARHLDVQVDAVEQGAGYAMAVAGHLFGCAAAAPVAVAVIAARAGVHGGYQLKARGEFNLPRRARHADPAGFQRFAQNFQHVPFEFR